MRVYNYNSTQNYESLRNMLETSPTLSAQVENRLSNKSNLTKLFNSLPFQYKKAQLLETAQILIENDQKEIPKTYGTSYSSTGHRFTFGTSPSSPGHRFTFTQILPIPDENIDQTLTLLVDHVNMCIRDIPECKKKKWFKDHERDMGLLLKAQYTNQPVTI